MPKRRRTKTAGRARRKVKRTRAASRKKPAPHTNPTRGLVRQEAVVTIRTMFDSRIVEGWVFPTAPIVELMEEWSYLLRSRARWVDRSDVRLSLRDRALADLEKLGLTTAYIRQLANTQPG